MTGFKRTMTIFTAVAAVASVGLLTGAGCPTPTPAEPLAVTVSASPTSGTQPLVVLATATATGGTGTYSYQWTAFPGGVIAAATASSTNVAFATAGTYTISVTVSDGQSTASASATVTVNAPPPPPALAVAVSPATATVAVGENAALTATATGGTAPYTYQWALTSGPSQNLIPASADSALLTVVGTNAGTTALQVLVTDSAGATATATATVEVTAAPTPPSFEFTLNLDNLSGTAGDDTFTAPLIFNPGTGTQIASLQTGDRADGLAGTDTLNATFGAAAANTIVPVLANIEVYNISDLAAWGNTSTLDATSCTGIQQIYSLNSTARVIVDKLQTLPTTIGITGSSVGMTLSNIATAATSGAADVLNLVLSNATNDSTVDRSVVTIGTASSNGIEELNITSSGAANTLKTLTQGGTAATLAKITVAGDQRLTIIDALDNSVLTFDASAMTAGGVDVTMGNGAITFTGGAGDDVVSDAGNYATTDIIDGGAGTNTLKLTDAEISGAAVAQTNVTNIQALSYTDACASAATVSRFGSIATVNLEAGFNAGSFSLPSGGTVTIGKKGTADVAGAGAGTVTVSGVGTTDVINFVLNDADPANTITFTGVETLNVASNRNLSGADAGGSVNAFAAGGVTLTPSAGGTGTVNISGDTSVNLRTVTGALVINAGSFAKNVTLTLGGAATYTGGSGVDTITGSAGNDSISGGAGNDDLSGLAGNDAISGGAGNDTITGGAGSDTLTGGDGNDTFVYAAAADMGGDTITDFNPPTSGSDVIRGAAALTGGAVNTFTTSATLAAMSNNTISRISASQTTAQINAATTGAAVAAWALILDSTKGYAVLVYDGDWSDVGSRYTIDLPALTSQAAIDALANGTIITQ